MKKSIAIIDDDEIYKIIIGKMIHNSGLFDRVYLFDDSREALEVIDNKKFSIPEIILLDLNMPHLDGWEFLDHLKKQQPGVYFKTEIYIVTSSISENDKDRAARYEGVQEFISKPITQEVLKKIASS